MKATVAARGQVTIPKAIRQQLGLKTGTILDIQLKGSTLTAKKAEQGDPIEKVYGCLGKIGTTDEIMNDLRGKA